MLRVEVDMATGEETEISLTSDEIAAMEAARAEAEQLAAAEQVAAPLTARERLEAAGFSIEELRELLSGGAPSADTPSTP